MNDKSTALSSDIGHNGTWSGYASVAYCSFICILALFHQTVWSMVSTWVRSDTFAHCFLVFPIVIWLIWDRRKYLSKLKPEPEYWVLLLVAGAGFLWLLSYLVDVLVIQQLAVISVLVFSMWSILGNKVSWAMMFPLLFLFFSVPMGEDLVPNLMEFTATFTVWLVKLTGIPVYREGLYFSLPSGDWSVVAACSGVRYLIASLVLGSLFAYLTYQSSYKRLLFILISILVPIIANGIRAYIIVMIGHFSNMKLATGADHLLYGWLFFGLVILILFSIGSIWRDTRTDEHHDRTLIETEGEPQIPGISTAVKSGTVILLITGVWPLLAYAIEHQQPPMPVIALQAPQISAGWEASADNAWMWRPITSGADEEIYQFYNNKGKKVSLYMGQYLSQQQGNELVNSQNVLVKEKDVNWRVTSNSKTDVRLNDEIVEIDQAIIKGAYEELLVWHWYRVGEKYTSNPYIAKIHEAMARLIFKRQDGVKFVVATKTNGSIDMSSNDLQQFLDKMLPEMENALDLVVKNIR